MQYRYYSLILFLLLAACELFIPRDAEDPAGTSDPYAWKPPTSPEIVLENLANAFPAHKLNYHLDVLSHDLETAPEFVFIPDEGVASSQPGVFENWDYVAEENFLTRLYQLLDPNGLQHLEWTLNELSPIEDHYEIIADYALTLTYIASRDLLPTHLGGQAILTLVQNTEQLYEISVWRDIKADTLSCWSNLKTQVQ